MADALLGTVIENLASFLQQELATFWDVEEQIQKLSGYLTTIRVVLKDAEEKQITNPAVRLWLQKLADAAHVLEDILDECSIIESNQQAHSVCITRFTPQRILSRYDIGKRMKKVAERFDVIAEERRKFELHAGIVENQPEDDEWRETSSAGAAPKVYGRDGDRERIVEILLSHACDSEDLSIYSIVGLGGHGKTTIAQLVFNDERVTQHFDLKIWVCVSDVFSMMRILQSIIESVTGQNPNLTSLESMQKRVQELLQSKRYLLVLDDVWSEDQVKWDKLKSFLQYVTEKKGASILVTTRLGTVASIVGTYPAHHLQGLSEDDVWSLFKQHAFGLNAEECVELEEIGKEILKKCAGSPLAVKVLGILLRGKTDERQWLSVKESKFWDLTDDQYSPIMSALRLSYFNLKVSLRRCFSFYAIFPKDFEMVKEHLIHLWMANGFISSRGNSEVEQVGNEVWNELHQRSFFQDVKTDELGNVTFKMHDLVHDLAQSIVEGECIVSSAADLTNLSSRVHHISCLFSFEQFNYNKIPFKKVESLRTFLEFNPLGENFEVFPSIKPLRALCLSSSQLSALKNLTHLRYLELNRSWITTIPESICGLHRLQTLKLERCHYLSSIPNQLTQLQDLRHLMIKDCYSLVRMPSKIGKLTRLRSLSVYIVGSKEGTGLAELHDLPIGGKLHIKGLEKVSSEWDAKNTNLIAKKDLNRLYLTWGSYPNSQGASPTIDAERVLEFLEPHSNLRSFGMNGYKGLRVPNWMVNTCILKGLVYVILKDCKNLQRLPPLGKLPYLTTLYASGMKDVKYIDDDSYDPAAEKAFPSLKELILRDLPNLERMLEAEGVETLPLLSKLVISGIPKLTLPSLPSVKELAVIESDSFPAGVLRNTSCVTKLDISSFNKLETLPDELGSLGSLEALYINGCGKVESFPEHVLQGLSSLRSLTISVCPKLKSLSEGVGHLTCLENLVFYDCSSLLALPSNMNQLSALRKVEIWGSNKSNALPEGLERIPCLQTLIVRHFPHLTSLPDSLGAMVSLQNLGIHNCPKLSSLPSWSQQHRNLKSLRISYCPELEKRCKQGTGEDWQKIAHIPEFKLESSDSDEKSNICERMSFLTWKMRKFFLHNLGLNYTPKWESSGFDRMVDKL